MVWTLDTGARTAPRSQSSSGALLLQKAVSVQMLSAGAGLAAAVILQFALARLLGPQAFGVYGLVVSVQHFAMIGQDGGFRTLIMRETAQPSPTSLAARGATVLAHATGHVAVATVPVLALALLVTGSGFWLPVLLAVAGGGAKTLTGFVSATLLGRAEFIAEARWQTEGRILTAAAGIATAAVWPDAGAVLLALLAAQCLCVLPILHDVRLAAPRFGWTRELSLFAGKMTLLAFLTALYFRAGTFFLFLSSASLDAVARFALMHRLLDAALFMIAPLAQIAFVRSSQGAGLPLGADRRVLLAGAAWLIAGLLGTIAGFSLGEPLVALAAGEAYRGAGSLAGWFALALTAAGPNFVLMQTLLARNGENAVLACSAAAVAASCLANLAFVPVFGAAGAAGAIVCAEAALFAMLCTATAHSARPMPAASAAGPGKIPS